MRKERPARPVSVKVASHHEGGNGNGKPMSAIEE